MTHTPGITRAARARLIEALKDIGAATVAGTLGHMGIRNPHMQGPVSWNPGKSIVGPAITLQFLPKREDLYGEDEYTDPEKQLHRHALYHVEPGDVVVVDARADMTAGVFGDMMSTYFKGRGGAGMVIDGCLRDYPNLKRLDLPLWIRGWTPNFHTQTGLMPFAVNVPIACGGVTVIPGDIIVADDETRRRGRPADRAGRAGDRGVAGAPRVGGFLPHEAAGGRAAAALLSAARGCARRVRGVAAARRPYDEERGLGLRP